MEKQEEQQAPRGHSPRLNKKALIIGGVIAVLFLLVSAFFLLESNTNPGTLPPSPSLSPSQTAVNPSGTVNPRFNPLINNKEVERVESSLRKKMEEAGITISQNPSINSNTNSIPLFKTKARSNS